ncbi:MAG: hypothetical protein OEY44_00285 [Candidatus Peregrinibacteria bacterium]|nr:hypothetical protein [Candidatus Peregrinibacteria bacterium]
MEEPDVDIEDCEDFSLPDEKEVSIIFEQGSNFWRSAAVVAKSVAEQRGIDAGDLTEGFRLRLVEMLDEMSGDKYGPLQRKSIHMISEIERAWACLTDSDSSEADLCVYRRSLSQKRSVLRELFMALL